MRDLGRDRPDGVLAPRRLLWTTGSKLRDNEGLILGYAVGHYRNSGPNGREENAWVSVSPGVWSNNSVVGGISSIQSVDLLDNLVEIVVWTDLDGGEAITGA